MPKPKPRNPENNILPGYPKLSFEEIRASVGDQAQLIAVSKLQPAAAVRALADKGQKVFAENYVQEALAKIAELADPRLEWHFIGHLQRNKVKQVVGVFSLLHGVDRLELAEEIQKTAHRKGLIQKILLEVNAAGENSKSGFFVGDDVSAFRAFAAGIRTNCPNVEIRGLMTMPPLFENPELARPYFQKLRLLRDALREEIPTCVELSMGTSGDFKIALEEGATMVRLGTVLFGARPS